MQTGRAHLSGRGCNLQPSTFSCPSCRELTISSGSAPAIAHARAAACCTTLYKFCLLKRYFLLRHVPTGEVFHITREKSIRGLRQHGAGAVASRRAVPCGCGGRGARASARARRPARTGGSRAPARAPGRSRSPRGAGRRRPPARPRPRCTTESRAAPGAADRRPRPAVSVNAPPMYTQPCTARMASTAPLSPRPTAAHFPECSRATLCAGTPPMAPKSPPAKMNSPTTTSARTSPSAPPSAAQRRPSHLAIPPVDAPPAREKDPPT